MNDLPTKLKNEPLVDAIFEMRFEAKSQFASVVPGILYSGLEGVSKITDLPQKDLPKPIRDSNPLSKYAPIVQIEWNQFFINIGDHSISVGCRLPYPGWPAFRAAIFEVVEKLKQLSLVEKVERHSMNFVNIIKADSVEDQIKSVKLAMSVGNYTLERNDFAVMMNVNSDQISHRINLNSSANTNINGENIQGVVLAIDSIVNYDSMPFADWYTSIGTQLDALRAENKKIFFSCITEATLKSMGPTYE